MSDDDSSLTPESMLAFLSKMKSEMAPPIADDDPYGMVIPPENATDNNTVKIKHEEAPDDGQPPKNESDQAHPDLTPAVVAATSVHDKAQVREAQCDAAPISAQDKPKADQAQADNAHADQAHEDDAGFD